jgi:hypothetical protein
VFYEGEDPDLGGQSLEDIASTVNRPLNRLSRWQPNDDAGHPRGA